MIGDSDIDAEAGAQQGAERSSSRTHGRRIADATTAEPTTA